MGLSHSETSFVLNDISDDVGLDEFDSEAERRAEPPEVRTAAAGSLRFAPEEKLRIVPVIEQYGPADLDRFEPPRPLVPRWNRTRVAGVAILVAVFAALPVAMRGLPEPRAAYPEVPPVRTVEVRSAPPAAAIVPASAPLPNPGRTVVGRQSANAKVSSFAAQSRAAFELNTIRQALASLEGQNVPLERCTARVAAYDRVVARCGSEPGEEWTLDFNRALDRWQVVGAPAR